MALRIEAGIGAAVVFCATAWAAPVAVRHKHWRKSAAGELRVEQDKLAFREPGGKSRHSREWKYEDIQQLVLGPEGVRLLTYEDMRWQFGRDREYQLDGLPEGFAAQVYPLLRVKLDRRLIAAQAEAVEPSWQLPAKLQRGFSGSQGVLLVAADRVIYKSDAPAVSRTWRLADIEQVSSSGPYELTITTIERTGRFHDGPREARFQLKERLVEDRYNQLWKAVNRLKGEGK